MPCLPNVSLNVTFQFGGIHLTPPGQGLFRLQHGQQVAGVGGQEAPADQLTFCVAQHTPTDPGVAQFGQALCADEFGEVLDGAGTDVLPGAFKLIVQ